MKRRKLLFILPIFLIVGITIFHFNNKDIDIEKVLKTNNYSYLNSNAKDYIRNYYNETGEVLLTEKNKEDGKAYLNPDYIEYLENNTTTDTGYIPDILTYDYNYKYNLEANNIDDLPSKYDSRDVDGYNYVTPLKKQYSELCWNYAFTSTIESKLLKEEMETDVSSLDLSERVIDYATSDPISAIDTGVNPYYGNYTLNSLAEGGNEYRYSSALVNGLFPIEERFWEHDIDYMGKVKPEEIYDLYKMSYQVNEVLFIEDNNYELGLDENTNKLLKQHIINDGAVGLSLRVGAGKNYVNYIAEEEERLNGDSNINYLYYKDKNAQYQSNDHTVSIIGWDDDYTHTVCVLDTGELTDSTNNNGTYSCSEGTKKIINGAWIIKDSANASYHYVAYETVNSDYFAVTDISYRDWNNVYSSSNKNAYIKGNNNTYIFNKQDNDERVNSIKFYAITEVTNAKVYIDTHDDNNEQLIATINTEIGGMYTIQINDEILLKNKQFSIRLENSNAISDFSVLTNNYDNNINIDIEDANVVNSFNYQSLLDNYQNVIIASGISRNIDINDPITYVIRNTNNEIVTDSFNITRNYPVGNYVHTLFRFNNDLPLGEYSVSIYIDNELYNVFKININNYMENIAGDGSEENPFIITNPTQLDMIRLNKYNYYELGNDIDLTYDTQNENGLFYNDGLGWEPISYSSCRSTGSVYCYDGFSGIFNGNNHKIIGLYINRPNEDIVGLFKNTNNTNYSGLNFRNLNFKDVNITGKNYVGALIGYAYGTTYERNLIFENISVSGNITGNDYVGGIVGYFNGGTGLQDYLVPETKCTKRHCLNNLINSATITGNNYVGGIVGLLGTQDYYNANNPNWRSTIDAYNWQNNGVIITNDKGAGLIGRVVINNGNTITLNNAINTGKVKNTTDTAVVNDMICNTDEDTISECSLVLNNIYYTNQSSYTSNLIAENNVKKYSIFELTNNSIYSSEFLTNFKQETINDIIRIPFLNNASVDYINANDIVINGNNPINIFDYIDGPATSDNTIFDIIDTSIATIDANGIITPLKSGTTTLYIASYYDGYENDINLTVNLDNETYTITYNLDGGIVDNPSTYTEETETFTLEEPTKEGYYFTGWTGSNGTTPQKEVIIEKGSTGNKEYTANWTPIVYAITYDLNGGKFLNQISTYTIETETFTIEDPIREGYIFIGWTGPSLSDLTKTITITKGTTGNKAYIANWKKEEQDFQINIDGYTYDETTETISDILENTTKEQLLAKITVPEGYKVETDITDKVFTGSKIKIYYNDTLYKEITNIVLGDVNGDGELSVFDIVKINNHIVDTEKQLQGVYSKAGDYNKDGELSVFDIVKINNKIISNN